MGLGAREVCTQDPRLRPGGAAPTLPPPIAATRRCHQEIVGVVQVAEWQETLEVVLLEEGLPESVPGILELELRDQPEDAELGSRE